MKIILMGQQIFGRRTLEVFHKETNHKVVAVLCEPDVIDKPIISRKFSTVFFVIDVIDKSIIFQESILLIFL